MIKNALTKMKLQCRRVDQIHRCQPLCRAQIGEERGSERTCKIQTVPDMTIQTNFSFTNSFKLMHIAKIAVLAHPYKSTAQ